MRLVSGQLEHWYPRWNSMERAGECYVQLKQRNWLFPNRDNDIEFLKKNDETNGENGDRPVLRGGP